MKRKLAFVSVFGLLGALPLFAHDLFLKLDNYFVRVYEPVKISILNGSFLESEGAVTFSRLQDVSVVLPNGLRSHPVEADLTKTDKTSFLNLVPKTSGNYVVGLATMARDIDLEGKDFNAYLTEDGIPDTLAERERDKELEKKVRERYSKYVKTIFQAGDRTTNNFNAVLGYPVEITPQTNPYESKSGTVIDFLCSKDGKPLANQLVMSGREANGKIVPESNVRTNKNGIARIKLTAPGKWYVRFINMTRLTDPKVNYESKWATLTFEIK